MTHRAFALSLAVHAAFLVMVGTWLAPTARHAGPGDPGAGVTFTEDRGSGLLVESAPAAEAAPLPPEAEFQPPAPELDLPRAVDLLTTKNSPLPAPALPPIAAKTKMEKVVRAQSRPRGNRPAVTSRRGGSAGEGAGLAGTGGGGGYVPPQFRLRYKPAYPDEARARRLEGTVLLLVSLDARGRVNAAALQRTSGHAVLDRAALGAVRSWVFEPARQGGTAVAAQVEIPIRFRFEESAALIAAHPRAA